MQVGQLGTNCYLLEDEETRTAAVVDPGGEGARILAQLKADGMELKLILLTHAHFDLSLIHILFRCGLGLGLELAGSGRLPG